MTIKKIVIAAIVLALELVLVPIVIPGNIAWICLILGAIAASYFIYAAREAQRSETRKPSRHITMLSLLSMLIIPVIVGWLTLYLGYLSIATALLATA